jgi:AraC-like DNA-binding protein
MESVGKYVECYWFLEKEQHDQSHIYPKLNPDPSSHLIIGSNHHLYRYDYEDVFQTVQGNHWIFPHLKTFTMDHSSPFKIVGIKFRVGALYSLKLPDFGKCFDKVELVDINQLFNSESFNAANLLNGALEQNSQTCNILDETLAAWVLTCHEDRHSNLVRQIIPLLTNTPITEIGERLHRSQRTIERSFMRVTGLTMKQCQSMIRLEEILSYLYQLNEAEIDWTDVASKYDFSDQPHLIRHLKNSIGNTPSEYIQNRDLTIDVYGDFEFN